MAQKKTSKSKAKSNFEDKKSDEKIVDAQTIEVEEISAEDEPQSVKESEKTSGKTLLFYFVAFLIVVSVFGFFGYKFLLGANKVMQVSDSKSDDAEVMVLQQVKTRDEAVIEQSDMQYGDVSEALKSTIIDTGEIAIDAAESLVETVQEVKVVQEIEIIEPEPIAENTVVYNANNKAIDNSAVEALRLQVASQNQYILLFLSAQNLQKILDSGVEKIDEKAMRNELGFFKEISGGKAGYAGRTQLLEYSLDGGAPSIAELEADLDVIVKKLKSTESKSFWQNFQEAIFGLVKVTKLDAEIEGQEGDYAKILLAKKALQNQDFNAAIALVEKISGVRTQEWKDKAYKLQRMHETVGYLIEATRKNLLESHKVVQ